MPSLVSATEIPLWASGVCAGVHAAGSRHVVYVPDNPLSHVLRISARDYPDITTTLATREEEAFGIAAGAVSRRRTADGDAAVERARQLAERADVAAAALPDSRADGHQHARRRRRVERRAGADGPGRRAPILRRDRRAARNASTAPTRTPEIVRRVGQTAFGTRLPGVCLLPRAAHRALRAPRCDDDPPRRDARAGVARSATSRLPIVASLGHPAYDLFAAGDRPANFYTWGSMGLASSIGLGPGAGAAGSARASSLDGDGSLLMNLGSLATIGWTRPHESRRHRLGQRGVRDHRRPGHGDRARRRPRGGGAGDGSSASRDGRAPRTSFGAAIARARVEPGPWVIVAKVAESAPTVKPPLDCVFIKQRFMAAIGRPEAATPEATRVTMTDDAAATAPCSATSSVDAAPPPPSARRARARWPSSTHRRHARRRDRSRRAASSARSVGAPNGGDAVRRCSAARRSAPARAARRSPTAPPRTRSTSTTCASSRSRIRARRWCRRCSRRRRWPARQRPRRARRVRRRLRDRGAARPR